MCVQIWLVMIIAIIITTKIFFLLYIFKLAIGSELCVHIQRKNYEYIYEIKKTHLYTHIEIAAFRKREEK